MIYSLLTLLMELVTPNYISFMYFNVCFLALLGWVRIRECPAGLDVGPRVVTAPAPVQGLEIGDITCVST